MFTITALLIIFPSFGGDTYSGAPSACGLYEIAGIVEKSKDSVGYIYKVNKGTLSEQNLVILKKLEFKILAFINRPSKLTSLLKNKFDGNKGELNNLEQISFRFTDDLYPLENTGFKLISKKECNK